MADRPEIPGKQTAASIAERFLRGDETPERVLKAKRHAKRSNVPWREVEAVASSRRGFVQKDSTRPTSRRT